MVYPQRDINPADALRRFFAKPSVLPRLILVNLAIFLVVYLTSLFLWLFQLNDTTAPNIFAKWFAVPSEPAKLMAKPWTIITYMFLHLGPLHLLFNMWMLYFGGQLFLRYLSERQLLATYIYGGLTGAVVYIAAYNIFPVFLQANPFAIALGASASVLAVLVAIAAWVPNYPVNLLFLGVVRIKYIALVLVIIDFFSIQGSNPGGHLAHLGGALWGISYASLMRKGFDPAALFNIHRVFAPKARFRTFPGETKGRPETDEQYNRRKAAEQQAIDRILDKIAQSGYDSLNSKEKETLFRSSNKKS